MQALMLSDELHLDEICCVELLLVVQMQVRVFAHTVTFGTEGLALVLENSSIVPSC
jgi:hypothetical protein